MPPHNRFPSHPPFHPPHSQLAPHLGEYNRMSNNIEIEAVLIPIFGPENSAKLTRCVEYARPLEAGPKLALGAHLLKNLASVCAANGIDVEAETAWLKHPIDISHPRAMAYSLVYSNEGSSLFSKTLNEANAENMRHRLTHGPMEMQANTIIELAAAFLADKLASAMAPVSKPNDTQPEKSE